MLSELYFQTSRRREGSSNINFGSFSNIVDNASSASTQFPVHFSKSSLSASPNFSWRRLGLAFNFKPCRNSLRVISSTVFSSISCKFVFRGNARSSAKETAKNVSSLAYGPAKEPHPHCQLTKEGYDVKLEASMLVGSSQPPPRALHMLGIGRCEIV